jgi:predicted lipase
MITKQEIKDCMQMCINAYFGHHGKIIDIEDLKNVVTLKVKHTLCQVGDYKNYIVVIFQGSSNWKDWIDNLNFVKVYPYSKKYIGIHAGFYSQFKTIIGAIKKELSTRDTNKEIIFTGHSLGGALATLVTFYFQSSLKKYCITFGSPRVGNSFFKRAFDKLENCYSLRYVYKNDIVTKVPMSWRILLFWFSHVSTKVKLGKISFKEKIRYFFGKADDHEPMHYLNEL